MMICSHGKGMPIVLVVGSNESSGPVEKESIDRADSTLRERGGADRELGGERAWIAEAVRRGCAWSNFSRIFCVPHIRHI